jgi:hypothetical protein
MCAAARAEESEHSVDVFPPRHSNRRAQPGAFGRRASRTRDDALRTLDTDEGSPHGESELCPILCPNACLPSTNTISYGETPRDTFRELSR